MSYQKQNFRTGDTLYASQLDAMEEGIINAERLAMEGAAGAANMEKGTAALSTQQTPRTGADHGDKVTQKEGEECPHFDFTGYERAKEITGKAEDEKTRIPFGAIGKYSASMNGRSSAQKNHAFAANNSTIAAGEESFAAGYETIAEGNGSAAFGSRTWAKGTESHTEGILTLTEGQAAHAEGSLTKAKGDYSHAEGYMTEANGLYNHTEGSATKTYGFSSHAEGNETVADTNASHAEGSGTKAVSYFEVNSSDGDDPSSGNNSGTSAPPSNYDEYESVEDYRVRAAACSHAEGNNTIAMGYSSHAEGVGTGALGRASHTEGWETHTGASIGTELDGKEYVISDPTVGVAAHAEGYATWAKGNYSHAEGKETEATEESAHAEGIHTQATGNGAHAEGIYTEATAIGAHAEGWLTKATQPYSHASGSGTITSQSNQTVVGQYNKRTSQTGSMFVVGGGENDNDALRRNAFEVIRDGEIIIYWENNYYSLNLMLNLIANRYGGPTFFDDAKKKQ